MPAVEVLSIMFKSDKFCVGVKSDASSINMQEGLENCNV